MKLFKCQACGQLLYFENRACGRCGHRLGYLPELGQLSAVEPDGAGGGRSPILTQVPLLQQCRFRRLQLVGRSGRERTVVHVLPA
jgi:hypothetical protein